MKQLSKDPFEVAFEEENNEEENNEEEEHEEQHHHQQEQQQQQQQEEKEEKSLTPPESPIRDDDDYDEIMVDTQTTPSNSTKIVDDELNSNVSSSTLNNNTTTTTTNNHKKKKKPNQSSTSVEPQLGNTGTAGKNKEDEEEDEEENMDVELGKFPSSGDPDKMAKMQAILSQFTEEQMSRYESFRRSGFQKANMKKLLASITGSPKISIPMTIVVSGIAKMFVGELVETGRMIMTERGETGPIRPCHIREAYRRLKLEGKVPRKSVPRLFR